MRSAYGKDIIQSIGKSRKRFLAMMIITILGVAMFSGLQAACEDLRKSADRFFDIQNLHDLSVMSTLGLTEEDVAALEALEEVEAAEGIYSEAVTTQIGEKSFSILLQTLSEGGIDTPYLLEGYLPRQKNEAAVTQKFLDDAGLEVGDTFLIEEEPEEGEKGRESESPTFSNTIFTITGIVIDVTNVDNPSGSTSFRSGTLSEDVVFILPQAAETEVYTGIYLTLKDTKGLFCYDSAYEEAAARVKEQIENEIKAQREEARYRQVTEEAYAEFAEAEEEVQKELEEAEEELRNGEAELKVRLAEAEQELSDGEWQLSDGFSKLIDGERELLAREQEARTAFAEARKELEDGKDELERQKVPLAEAKVQLEEGERKLQDAVRELSIREAQAKEQMAAGREQLQAALSQTGETLQILSGQTESAEALLGEQWPQTVWEVCVDSLEEEMVAELRQAGNLEEETVFAAAEKVSNANGALREFVLHVSGGVEQQIAELDQQIQKLEQQLGESAGREEGEPESDGTLQKGIVLETRSKGRGGEQKEEGVEKPQESGTEGQKEEGTEKPQRSGTEGQKEEGAEKPQGSGTEGQKEEVAERTPENSTERRKGEGTENQPKNGGGMQRREGTSSGPLKKMEERKASGFAGTVKRESVSVQADSVEIEKLQEELRILYEKRQMLSEIPGRVSELAVGTASWQAVQVLLEEQLQALEIQAVAMEETFAGHWAEIRRSGQELQAGRSQWEEGVQRLQEGAQTLEAGEKELKRQENSAALQIAEGYSALESNRQQMEAAVCKLSEGRAEYEKGKEDAERELSDGWKKYAEGKEDAEKELSDARKEIEEIAMATWYVEDRNSLSGYANIGSDANSIEAIATVFPIVFFVVAILISLTTVTRMVEEDRGLIGTYKALGFTNAETRRKYLVYTLAAGMAGSVIGTAAAFIVLPKIVFIIFRTMYLLPEYELHFIGTYGLCGPLLFVGGILVATILACQSELLHTPAVLMRPRAPRAGSRVFLEKISLFWNHMSFLNKVTARNLFRYKKRLLMTVFGIAGCMALLLFGFAIKDSVTDLMPRQYEKTFYYDLMAVSLPDDYEQMLSYLEQDENVAEYMNTEITEGTLKYADDKEVDAQVVVVPDGKTLSAYIQNRNLEGEEIVLEDGEIYVTQNAGNVLGFHAKDHVFLKLHDLQQAEILVTGLVQNYLGNYVYMTQKTFKTYYEEYEPNGVLLKFSDRCLDQTAYAKELEGKDGVLTSLSTEELKAQFSTAFVLINMVVYVIIVMSAALAFVVLFTLSTTNISERERELATIKVLGFYDREVHLYVDKETLLLTGMGIILGIPLGTAFAETLTAILNLPSIYLAVSLHPVSYVISAGLTAGFALLVNLITDRSLDRIDPVEALKSIE